MLCYFFRVFSSWNSKISTNVSLDYSTTRHKLKTALSWITCTHAMQLSPRLRTLTHTRIHTHTHAYAIVFVFVAIFWFILFFCHENTCATQAVCALCLLILLCIRVRCTNSRLCCHHYQPKLQFILTDGNRRVRTSTRIAVYMGM